MEARMSGGPSAPLPLWLAKASAVSAAVAGLLSNHRWPSPKRKAVIEVQAKLLDFSKFAQSDWHNHNQLRLSLAAWIADQPDILREAIRSRTHRYGDFDTVMK